MFVLHNYGEFSVCFTPFGRCMVFGFLNNFISQPISGNSNVMSLEEVTLERITKNNTRFVMVLLRPVYHEVKKMESIGKNPWWKGIVRLVDKKGQGLYAEIRGGTEQLVQKRAKEFYQPKFLQLSELEVKQNTPFLAGFSADVTKTGKATPVAEAHPNTVPLRQWFPVAKSNIGRLTEHCQGYERADVVGVVTFKETPALKMSSKVTLWLKDESGTEIAIHLWGNRMTQAAANVDVGSVVQIDNCLLGKKLDGSIDGSAEHWLDNVKNMFSVFHPSLSGARVDNLKTLPTGRGDAISTPWLQTGAFRIKTDGLEKFISCCATVSACSLALTGKSAEATRWS